jgi:hypothetical protein
MARRRRESLLDDEIMQDLHVDRLPGAPSDCESDKSSTDDDDDFGPQRHRKAKKGRS